MKNIKAVLFDIDGTLLDTTEYIYQAFENTFRFYRLPVPSREELSSQIGKSLQQCYEHFITNISFDDLRETHRSFQADNLHLSKPYANTIRTLEELKRRGFNIAAVTARGGSMLFKTLELAGIDKFFDVIVTADDVKKMKPDPEAFLKALEILGIDKKNAVIVGDTDSDILAGKSANIYTIGVTYGFHGERINDSNPDFVVNDISEITSIIISD
jgi:pyrophosphatase PpaX